MENKRNVTAEESGDTGGGGGWRGSEGCGGRGDTNRDTTTPSDYK